MTLSAAAITIGFIALAIASAAELVRQVMRPIVPFSEGYEHE